MDAQSRQQLGQSARDELEIDVVAVEQRSDEVLLEVARRGGDGADAEDLALFAPSLSQDLDEFVAGREDAVRIGQRHPAGLGEDECAAGSVEQRLAKIGLQLLDLRGER